MKNMLLLLLVPGTFAMFAPIGLEPNVVEGDHTGVCVLDSDGAIHCPTKQFNGAGQTDPPPGTGFNIIDCSYSICCAREFADMWTCWGRDGGQIPTELEEYQQVGPYPILGVNENAVLGLTPAGKIEAFVTSFGDHGGMVSKMPSEVNAGIVVDLVVGHHQSAAIMNDGSCYVWGGYEHLDYGWSYEYNRPSEFNTGDDCGIASLIAGSHAVNLGALYNNGTLVIFGSDLTSDTSGQIDYAPDNCADCTSLSLGVKASCVTRDSGELVCWGTDIVNDWNIPTDDWAQIAVALYIACGIRRSTNAFECYGGDNKDDYVGTGLDSIVPQSVNSLECKSITKTVIDIDLREELCKSSSKNCKWKTNKGKCKVQKTKTKCKYLNEDACYARSGGKNNKKPCIPLMKNGVFKRCCNPKHGFNCISE